ncbi:MAG: hypothetical protein ABI240_05860 [Sphingomonas sp.]
MADIHPQYRELFLRIAQHEMGHYVVCRHFGFRTGFVSVQVDGLTSGHKGGAEMELNLPTRSLVDLEEYLWRRISVLYAGALSEPLFVGAPVKAITEDNQREAMRVIEDPQSGANVDHAKIRELRFILRNIRCPNTSVLDEKAILAELQALDEEAWSRTIKVVDQHYMTIVGLAGNMTQRLTKMREKVVMTAADLEAIPAVAAIQPV